MTQYKLRSAHGFTILEILTVMVLIALFFVVVVSAFQDHDLARHISAGDVLTSHIRYAQMRSMESGASWGIEYNSTLNAYWMFRFGQAGRILLPGESTDNVSLVPTGVTISQGNFTLRFDDWGRPISSLSFSGGQLNLTLVMDGEPNRDITVIQNTGLVRW